MFTLVILFLAWTGGDPHIQTLDGFTYTFNGIGDYTLLAVRNSSEFLIHSRMSLASVSSNSSADGSRATVFSAFAMKTDQGALVEIYLNTTSRFKKFSMNSAIFNIRSYTIAHFKLILQIVIIFSKSLKYSLQIGPFNFIVLCSSINTICFYISAGIVELYVQKKSYPTSSFSATQTINGTDITWTSGNKMQLTVIYESGVSSVVDVFENQLTIQVTSSSNFYNKTMGLLGLNNGDTSDDFTRPDGSTLPINSTQETIYYGFGKLCKWHHVISFEFILFIIIEKSI